MSTRYAEEDLRKLEAHFSPLEAEVLKILGDGKPHLKADLRKSTTSCSVATFDVMLSILRRKVQKKCKGARILPLPFADVVVLQLVVIRPAKLSDILA